MKRIARLIAAAATLALIALALPATTHAQADPTTISNRVVGPVTIYTLTNAVKYAYFADGSWVAMNSLGTNTGAITVTTISGTTGTLTTGAITTLNGATINLTGTGTFGNTIVNGTETTTNLTQYGTAALTNLTLNGWSVSIVSNRLTLRLGTTTNDFYGTAR